MAMMQDTWIETLLFRDNVFQLIIVETNVCIGWLYVFKNQNEFEHNFT
jgi:hypothetical protein